MGVGILTGTCTQSQVVDSFRKLAKQYTTAPAAVSVGFSKTMVTADSVQIKARTRFNISTVGYYSTTVFIVEDSAKAWQAQMVSTGSDTVAHRNMLRTPIGWVWGQMLSWTDTVFNAGDEYIKDFGYKIPSTWNTSKLRYIVAVYKWDQAAGNRKLINVTDGNFVPTAPNNVITRDVTNDMKVYPVPATNYVNIEMQTNESPGNVTISLYDIASRKVAELYTGRIQPGTPLRLQLPQNLPAGNYMLQLHNDVISAVKQVTIE
jgi:hypothetical protein